MQKGLVVGGCEFQIPSVATRSHQLLLGPCEVKGHLPGFQGLTALVEGKVNHHKLLEENQEAGEAKTEACNPILGDSGGQSWEVISQPGCEVD